MPHAGVLDVIKSGYDISREIRRATFLTVRETLKGFSTLRQAATSEQKRHVALPFSVVDFANARNAEFFK